MMGDALPSMFPFITDLSSEARDQLKSASKPMVLEPRTSVISRGDQISGAYLVTRGCLRIYYTNADGREGTLYWVDPGQSCILAMNCLFSELSYPAWVESDDKETHVTFIPGDIYKSLFQREHSVQKFTFETMSFQLFNVMTLLEETVCCGLEQRVAALLLRRANSNCTLETTHDSIARHLGSTREVVSRVLRNLARQGTVELQVGHIVIVDRDQLQRLSA